MSAVCCAAAWVEQKPAGTRPFGGEFGDGCFRAKVGKLRPGGPDELLNPAHFSKSQMKKVASLFG